MRPARMGVIGEIKRLDADSIRRHLSRPEVIDEYFRMAVSRLNLQPWMVQRLREDSYSNLWFSLKRLVPVFDARKSGPANFERFHAYVISAIRNDALEELRKYRTLKQGGGRKKTGLADLKASDLEVGESLLERIGGRESLGAAIKKLPFAGAYAITEFHLKGRRQNEIAEELGLSRAAFGMLIVRARRKLKKILENE